MELGRWLAEGEEAPLSSQRPVWPTAGEEALPASQVLQPAEEGEEAPLSSQARQLAWQRAAAAAERRELGKGAP